MGICIQQGKSNFIKGLVIAYSTTQNNRLLLLVSAATKFRGSFKLAEKIQIHGGAPLLILLSLIIAFILVLLLPQVPLRNFIWFWVILILFPISSLLPFKPVSVFQTDGYSISKDIKHLRLSAFQTIKELLRGVYLALRYVFLGSSHIRKSNNLINKKINNTLKNTQKDNSWNIASILNEELKNNPDDLELYNNIAWCYAELGTNLDRTIVLAHKAIELESTEACYHDTLGWCYFKKDDIDNAKCSLVRAINIDPHNVTFQNHLKEIKAAALKTT